MEFLYIDYCLVLDRRNKIGTLYYNNAKYIKKRWRIQIRHKGFRSISKSFKTKKEAQIFLRKAEKIMQKRIEERILDKIKNI